MLETDYIKKPTFQRNFWKAFKDVLGRGHAITGLDGCDFGPIHAHLMAEREAKKQLSKEVRHSDHGLARESVRGCASNAILAPPDG